MGDESTPIPKDTAFYRPVDGDHIMELEEVRKSFGELHVLKGVTIRVRRGETLVVIGQSGVGKSVSLRLLIGLLTADSGTTRFEGRDVAALSEVELNTMRIRFAMLFQSGALFDSMTVAENIGFGLRAHGERDDAKIAQVVEEKLRAVGLGKKAFPDVPRKLPSQLSGGQKKRVALARAIAMDPEIVLYDEPTTGLDPIMSDAIADLILVTRRQLQHKRVTSVVVTHDMHVALKTADRIIMLHGGEIVGEGSPNYFASIRDREDDAGMTDRERMIRQFVRGEAVGPIQAVQ